MIRYLKYSTHSFLPLHRNTRHRFAQDHALNIYKSSSIYSFIPKNACSTMRLSLARANGCIRDPKDFRWIHNNNRTFGASLCDLEKASYAFIILRDPFTRLVSVYLDKLINKNPVISRCITLHERSISYQDITFEVFVRSLSNSKVRDSNVHWKPQSDFLVYDEYDDYFCVEDFNHACITLKNKIDLNVIDARPFTKHHTSGYKVLCETEPYRISPIKLLKFKNQGYVPSPETMFNDELIHLVVAIYGCDIDLYKNKIHTNKLAIYEKLSLPSSKN